jgi:SAM-dependent methyltransferase
MWKIIKNCLRRLYLETKTRPDSIGIHDPIIYERLQFRPGQLEYIHAREMIQSTLWYFMPKIDALCKELNLERSQVTILDVGARDGWTVDKFKELGFNSIGVELVTELVKHAQSLGRNVIKADAHSLPFPDERFHVVFCRHTLEHTIDPAQALSELIRVTSSKGLVYVSLPIERLAHGKHTTAIPNLRVLKRLVDRQPVRVIELRRSKDTGIIIPDGDEGMMILQRIEGK